MLSLTRNILLTLTLTLTLTLMPQGTRVPVDFCEVPSHLIEYFTWDRGMLNRFAR
ncbi:unnamed protein product [Discosporangium mesarthrocarpum]